MQHQVCCRSIIYIWRALWTSEVLAVAISCTASVWCGYGLDQVARVSRHVCGDVEFRTCVVYFTMRFVSTIERNV